MTLQWREQAEAEHGHRADGQPAHCLPGRAHHRHGSGRQTAAVGRADEIPREWTHPRADVTQVGILHANCTA